MEERLQKYMARCGVASRRKCEELIVEGKVSVNGNVVQELGNKINPDVDKVTYCGLTSARRTYKSETFSTTDIKINMV